MYSFATRFEAAGGTNPEELIATAHAACFSMAFAGALEKAGFPPQSVRTTATATMEPVDGAPTIHRIDLETTARVPNISDEELALAAAMAVYDDAMREWRDHFHLDDDNEPF